MNFIKFYQTSAFLLAALLLAQAVDLATAEPDPPAVSPGAAKPQCSYYRSKKEKIPVYLEPDSTSKVIYRLKLGEEVCYIGEQSGFAIVNWPATKIGRKPADPKQLPISTPVPASTLVPEESPLGPSAGSGPQPPAGEPVPELVFVRLVDLWTPRPGRSLSTRQKGVSERLNDLYTYMRSGGVPESPMIPLGNPVGPVPSATPQTGTGSGDCGCGVEE